MKNLVILFVVLGGLVAACTDRDDEVDAIHLRIQNTSSLVFDSVIVGDAPEPHLNIVPDAYSEYLIYEEAYQYAYIEIVSGEESFILQPNDFVGETPLPIGFYTYQLDITESGEVDLTFVID